MDEEQQIAFFVEWYDPQSDQFKPYILHFYGDETLELVEKKTRKHFLKRIKIPSVTLQDLFIGNSLTIYSRKMKIMEAANRFTRETIQSRNSKCFCIIKPSGSRHLGAIVSCFERHGVNFLQMAMVQLEEQQLGALFTDFGAGPGTTTKDAQPELLQNVSVAIELRLPQPDAINQLTSELASKHLADHVIISERPEVNSLFSLPTTSICEDCTLGIIKPRIVREGSAGRILESILAKGFEISALKLMHLQMDQASEFFQVYKGILPNYHEVLKYMCSGPCVVLEIRGDQIVEQFRDFCGPFDIQVAKTLAPTSLRALFGKTNLENALHCTDCPEDGVLECQYFFHALTC